MRGLRTGREDHQLPVLGGRLRPEDRGVEDVDPVLVGERCDPAGPLDADRARLHPHRTVAHRSGGVRHHGQDGLDVEEHGDDDVGADDRLGGRPRDRGPVVGQGLGLLGAAVPDGDVESLADQAASHPGAHDPGAEYCH